MTDGSKDNKSPYGLLSASRYGIKKRIAATKCKGENKKLLRQWEWFRVRTSAATVSNELWEGVVQQVSQAIVAMIGELSTDALDVWLSVFGMVLPCELLKIANNIIEDDSDGRFYFPEVKKMHYGPGFVESWMNVEYIPGFGERIFGEDGMGQGGPLLGVLFTPKEHSVTVGCGRGLHQPNIFHCSLDEGGSTVLKLCRYVILTNRDMDSFTIGAKREHADKVEDMLRKFWPDGQLE